MQTVWPSAKCLDLISTFSGAGAIFNRATPCRDVLVFSVVTEYDYLIEFALRGQHLRIPD